MFCDSKSPANHRSMRAGIGLGHVANDMRGYACFALRVFERVWLDAAPILFEPGGGVFDEFSIFKSQDDDLASYRIGKDDICAHVKACPHVGPLHGGRTPRINRIEARSVPNSFEQMMEENRMCLPGVGSP